MQEVATNISAQITFIPSTVNRTGVEKPCSDLKEELLLHQNALMLIPLSFQLIDLQLNVVALSEECPETLVPDNGRKNLAQGAPRESSVCAAEIFFDSAKLQ